MIRYLLNVARTMFLYKLQTSTKRQMCDFSLDQINFDLLAEFTQICTILQTFHTQDQTNK